MRRMHWEQLAQACYKSNVTREQAVAIFKRLYKAFEEKEIEVPIWVKAQDAGAYRQNIDSYRQALRRVQQARFVRWALSGPPKSRQMSKKMLTKIVVILDKFGIEFPRR